MPPSKKNEWDDQPTGAGQPPLEEEESDNSEFPSSQTVVSKPGFPTIAPPSPAKPPQAAEAEHAPIIPIKKKLVSKAAPAPTASSMNLAKLQSLSLSAPPLQRMPSSTSGAIPRPPSRPKPIGKIIAAVVVLGAIGFGATRWADIQKKFSSPNSPTVVNPTRRFLIAEVSTRSATTLNASGYLFAELFTIGATVSGRIASVPVTEGQAVKKGQLLIQLDDGQLRSELNVQSTRVSNLRRILAQQQILRKAEAITQMEIERTRNEIAIASAEASVIAQKMKQLKITAPVDATVVDVLARPGETISTLAGATTGVIRLADLAHLIAESNVNEIDVGGVHVGDHAEVTIESIPGATFPATVKYIATEADRARGTVKVNLSLAPDKRLRPNLSVKIRFQGSSAPTPRLLIPRDAVVGNILWVVQGGVATRRTVTTSPAGADTVEIVTGLKAGERVIVSDFATLAEGDKITVP